MLPVYFKSTNNVIFFNCFGDNIHLCLCTSILGTHQTTNAADIDESLVTSTCYHNRNTRRSAWRVIVTTTSFLLDSAGTNWQVSHGEKDKAFNLVAQNKNVLTWGENPATLDILNAQNYKV